MQQYHHVDHLVLDCVLVDAEILAQEDVVIHVQEVVQMDVLAHAPEYAELVVCQVVL